MTASTVHACLPLGLADAAERYGVVAATLQQRGWRAARGRTRTEPLPDPDWTVSGRPAWCATHTLDPWAHRALGWQG